MFSMLPAAIALLLPAAPFYRQSPYFFHGVLDRYLKIKPFRNPREAIRYKAVLVSESYKTSVCGSLSYFGGQITTAKIIIAVLTAILTSVPAIEI